MTENDLILAIEDAVMMRGTAVDDAGYTTAEEISAAGGMPRWAVAKGLKALAAQGRLDVRNVTRLNIAGRRQGVPGYKLRE